jgi:alpha-1,6-mannosyltransferase
MVEKMLSGVGRKKLLFALGGALLIPYAATWWVGDLRQHVVAFEIIFWIAFAIYAAAVALAVRMGDLSRAELAGLFALAALMYGALLLTRPALSDDMYRYVWEGRLQAHGFSPYAHPPNSAAVAHLRDDAVWPNVNRKAAVTVYPPAAQLAYTLLWRIWPDSVHWFQVAMSLGALAAGLLLVRLLRVLQLSTARVVIYLWAPLLVFEAAHGAHVDGLVLPLLVGAWLARVQRRDGWVGLLLGTATAIKLFPILLLPALWRPRDPQGWWRLPAAFGATLLLFYLPYVWWSGAAVIGFLPNYFGERFNMGLAGWLIPLFAQAGINPNLGILAVTLVALALCAGWMVLQAPADDSTAIRRSIWLIGAFTILAQNLFSWYLLWVLPLVALFVRPGRLAGLRADSWTGWWLFCGLVMLSYTFFINWRPLPVTIWVQFVPLYLLLLVDLFRRLPLRSRQLQPVETRL